MKYFETQNNSFNNVRKFVISVKIINKKFFRTNVLISYDLLPTLLWICAYKSLVLAKINKNEFRASAIEVLMIRLEFDALSFTHNFEVGIIREFNRANKTTSVEPIIFTEIH